MAHNGYIICQESVNRVRPPLDSASGSWYSFCFTCSASSRRGSGRAAVLAASGSRLRLGSRAGWLGLAAATLTVTLAALGCLVAGSLSEGVGHGVSQFWHNARCNMRGERFIAAGPYRYVRNPLYLGAWLVSLGVSILMPPSGAAFFLPAFSLFMCSFPRRKGSSRKGRGRRTAVSPACAPPLAS